MDLRILGIDWQNDFVDPKGALYITGAEKDAERCAAMIKRLKNKITDIHETLDSHHFVDIAHPVWLVNSQGDHPAPFTLIKEDDLNNGTWRATNPQYQQRTIDYEKSLALNGRYLHCIWPPHCLIGSWGAAVYPALFEAFMEWENDFAIVDYRTKGSNPFTEHYSAIQADVPDPQDPTTMLDTRPGSLVDLLSNADLIALTGQALSHCLANTVMDIANNFGEENIKKLILIRDCTSSVPGFENIGENFIKEMSARGMQISTSTEFLA